jgi:hypothetical protein
MEAKKITQETTQFEANGNKYFITKGVSIRRFEEYEKLQVLLSYGASHQEIFKHLRKAWDLLNENKRNDATIVLYNLMSGIERFQSDDRVHPALLISTLFINRENEDPGKWSKELALEKIKDWTEAGYDISSFFLLALNSLEGFKRTYLEFINQISQKSVDLNQKST